jgi:uncharacterized protein YkwD
MADTSESNSRKILSIIVFIIAVVAFVIISSQIPKIFNVAKNTVSEQSVSREDLSKGAIIAHTNNARAQNGLPPLTENPLLNSIAEARVRDMLEKQYLAHVSPTGQQASDIAQSIGYRYKVIAENIGSGDFYSNQKVVDGWMQSPGHRNNILSTEVQEIGVAVLKGKMKGVETYVSVQIFGLQSLPVTPSSCTAPSEIVLREIEAKKAEIDSLRGQLERMKIELDKESESIETDKRNTYDDNQKIQALNERIRAFNEKVHSFKRIGEEAKAKETAVESMINEYNRTLQTYNECRASH